MGKITINGGAYNRQNLIKKDKDYLVDQCLGLKKRVEILEQRQEEVAKLRLCYKTMQEHSANMQSALEIAIEALDEYNEGSTIRDIKAVWRDGINGLEDWRKYEHAFDEDQIANQ